MKKHFDEKQTKIIDSWHTLAKNSANDYMKFMANWISFNAICYHLFEEDAVKERADIDRSKSKLRLVEERLTDSNSILAEKAELINKDDKWTLDIKFPERFFLSIKKKYTEDLIFDKFAEHYDLFFEDDLTLSKMFDSLKNSLEKEENLKDSENIIRRSYVINMSRIKEMSDESDVDKLARNGVIFLCESFDLMTIKNTLYQIRCNIFHGEKVPGSLNDDQITKAANPILNYIVKKLIDEHNITRKD